MQNHKLLTLRGCPKISRTLFQLLNKKVIKETKITKNGKIIVFWG